MKPRCPKAWHTEARRFFRQITSEYNFSLDELDIVRATCQHLDTYWKASDMLHKEGLVVESSGGMLRKHPASELVKNSWAGFLQGCKLLCIGAPPQPQKPIGRPPGRSTI